MSLYSEPSESPGFLLWHLTLNWQRAVLGALRPFDLTHVQFVLLATDWWAEQHGQALNQLELARRAGTDVKMTSEVVRRLETKGLLRRQVDPADTRARRVSTTSAGAATAARAIEAVERADVKFFGAEAQVLTAVLKRLRGQGLASHGVRKTNDGRFTPMSGPTVLR